MSFEYLKLCVSLAHSPIGIKKINNNPIIAIYPIFVISLTSFFRLAYESLFGYIKRKRSYNFNFSTILINSFIFNYNYFCQNIRGNRLYQ